MNKKFISIYKVGDNNPDEGVASKCIKNHYKYKKYSNPINYKIKNYVSISLIVLFVLFVILGYIAR